MVNSYEPNIRRTVYAYIKTGTKGKIMETVKRSVVAVVGGGRTNRWCLEGFQGSENTLWYHNDGYIIHLSKAMECTHHEWTMSYELWVITMWADVDNGGGYSWGGGGLAFPSIVPWILKLLIKKKKGTNNRICFWNSRKTLAYVILKVFPVK